jgi:hypothetical protein
LWLGSSWSFPFKQFCQIIFFLLGVVLFSFCPVTLYSMGWPQNVHTVGESMPKEGKEGLLWIASIGGLCVWLFWLVFGAYVLTKGEWPFCKTFIAFVNEITCNSPVRLREKRIHITFVKVSFQSVSTLPHCCLPLVGFMSILLQLVWD